MSKRKQFQIAEWQERLQMFTSGNRGRLAAIAAEGMTIVENKVLRDVEYDPVGKGDDLIITLGHMEDMYTHTVKSPAEIYINEEPNGEVSSMEIIDQDAGKTMLRLLNSVS